MRRTKPEKREVEPDLKYNNVNVQVLIHHVLKKGKKSTANTNCLSDAWILSRIRRRKTPLKCLKRHLKMSDL